MSDAALSAPAMLTVTLAADCSQEEWLAALDWANAYAAPVEPVFLDFGDQHVYLFPAA